MRAVIPRIHQSDEKKEVFRTPLKISDIVYEAFNTMAHKAKLAEGTAIYASRMIRGESLTREELQQLRDIMVSGAPETEISAEILGGRATISWINSILNPGAKS
jgi:hypothetical protein